MEIETMVEIRKPRRARFERDGHVLALAGVGIVEQVFPSGLLRIAFEIPSGTYTVDLMPNAVKIAK